MTPIVEGALYLCEILEATSIEHFGFKRTMEALVLAIGLGMCRRAMADTDAQPDQPYGKVGNAVFVLARTAPWRTIVGIHAYRQPIAAEGLGEQGLNALCIGSSTRGQPPVVTGMVIDHREGMTRTGWRGEIALEVDLPQLIRLCMLKTLPRSGLRAGCLADQPVPVQDGGHGARCWNIGVPELLQALADLASAPRRVFLAQCKHMGFEFSGRTRWRAQRPARSLLQTSHLVLRLACKPLVSGLRADAKAPAQLTAVYAFLPSQQNK